MTRHGSAKNIGRLLGFCLIIFAVASCTKDYFLDETNFRLYVPQIKNNQITNFYVAFHDENGNHAFTREVEAPFDKDDMMKNGILRFKIAPGKYNISCFADYNAGSITKSSPVYNESSISYNHYSQFVGQTDFYDSRTPDTRAFFGQVTALPIGHPGCKDSVEMDMNEEKRFMGNVGTKFIDLPDYVTRIDILYSGLATKLNFGGFLTRFSRNDIIYTSFNTAGYKSGNTVDYRDRVYPSSEITLGNVSPNRGGPDDPKELSLEVRFYSGEQIVGLTTYPGPPGSDDPIPTNNAGQPVRDLVLNPKDAINFTFKGFTVIDIRLVSWGEITEGGTTPM